LQSLITTVWVLLIPVGLLLVAVLFRLWMVLNDVSGFVTQLRYELPTILKDIRAIINRVERLSHKTEDSAIATERNVVKAGRVALTALSQVGKATGGVWGGVGAVCGLLAKRMASKIKL
jgi:predicted PurR-regulated permease PerM